MGQLFRPSANTICKLSMVLLLVIVAGGLGTMDMIHRGPYVRYTKVPHAQPVPFSHDHHVNMGIDCRYCHTTVEEAAFANIPPTKTCMNCHSQIYADAPMLAPVRESWANNTPIEWNRVHDLPDFVYFDHSIHVAKGIGCNTCHGQVDKMPLIWKEEPLFMKWCLDCHRNPEQFIRPREEVFNMAYQAPDNQAELGARLVEEYHVEASSHRLTDCWICHR